MVDESFRIETLRAVKLFEPLTDDELEVIRPAVGVCEYSVGDVVMAEGTPGDQLYVLLIGELKVVKNHRNANETVVASVAPVEVIGEMALLANSGLRSASVIATAPSRLLTLTRDALKQILLNHPSICLHLLEDAYDRIHHLVTKVGDATDPVK